MSTATNSPVQTRQTYHPASAALPLGRSLTFLAQRLF